jgi:hypothetical protein
MPIHFVVALAPLTQTVLMLVTVHFVFEGLASTEVSTSLSLISYNKTLRLLSEKY